MYYLVKCSKQKKKVILWIGVYYGECKWDEITDFYC